METIRRALVAIFVAMLFATIAFSQVSADSDTSSASITVELPKISVEETSDGTAIDQCVAYFLMLLSLLLTYIFH